MITKAEQALHEFLLSKGHMELCAQLTPAVISTYSSQVRVRFPQQAGNVSFIRRQVLFELAQEHSKITNKQQLDVIVQEAFDEFFHHRTLHVSNHLFPGSVQALQQFRALGLKVGTISNGNAQVEKIPELARLVDFHVSPAMHEVQAKPDREPFDLLRERFGNVPAHKVLHVGDSVESDVHGAIGAGMKACWVNLNQEDDTNVRELGCHLIVNNVLELAEMFTRFKKEKSGDYRFS